MEYPKVFWENVLEAADSLIVVVDIRGRIKFLNKKVLEVTGYKFEEVLGKFWTEIFVPARIRSRIQKIFDSLLQGQNIPQSAEYPILAKDGREIPVAWNRTFLKDKSSRTEALLSVGHDLTLARTIGEERHHTQTILDSIAEGVFSVDRDMRITFFNRAATQITGFTQEEALGQPCSDIFRAPLCAGECPLKTSLQTGRPLINLETDILNKENREIPVSISTAVRRDSEGNPVGGILVFRDITPITELEKELKGKYSFRDFVTKNKSLLELFQNLPVIAETDATVLITGETGTGKELIATALHHLSPRQGKPLIKVNCGAFPETLLESELFGYKRGAFTDAKKDKPGRFKMAEGGTLFLDEIGDISPGTQIKLLRVLENKEYEPLGGTKTEKADVRIVSATNKNLEALVRSNQFREDLYYRLNLFTIEIPPLRQRREDIPLLIDHFLERFRQIKGGKNIRLHPSALKVLLNYDYPGNVRELQNILEHAFILGKGTQIGRDCLPAYLLRKPSVRHYQTGKEALRGLEKDMILRSLQNHGGKIQEAADELGVHRTTLWRKMKRHKIAPTEGSIP